MEEQDHTLDTRSAAEKSGSLDTQSVNPEGIGAVPVRRTTRITHHEIKAMKAVTTKAPPAHLTILNKLKTMVHDLTGSIVSLFTGKKPSQCDLNGHTFPKGVWEGEFPRCSHCLKEIKSAEEMGTR